MNFDAYKERSKAFKALGHPTRLMLVETLSKGPACVNDLQAVVGYDMSTVSKHLSVLREAKLVQDRRQGNQVFYSLTCQCIMDFLNCIEKALKEESDVFAAAPGGLSARAASGAGS